MAGEIDLARSTSEWTGEIKPFQLDGSDGHIFISGLRFVQSSERIFEPFVLGTGTLTMDEIRFELPDATSMHMKGLEATVETEDIEGQLSMGIEYQLKALRVVNPAEDIDVNLSGVLGYKISGLDIKAMQETMRHYQNFILEPTNEQVAKNFGGSVLTMLTSDLSHTPKFAIDPLHVTFGDNSLKGHIEASIETSEETLNYFLDMNLKELRLAEPFEGYQHYTGTLGFKINKLDLAAVQEFWQMMIALGLKPNDPTLEAQALESMTQIPVKLAQHRPSMAIDPLLITFGEDRIEGKVEINLDDLDAAMSAADPSLFLQGFVGQGGLTLPVPLAVKLMAANTKLTLEEMRRLNQLDVEKEQIPELATTVAMQNLQQAQEAGWLKVEGEVLTSNALLNAGKLIVNGRELPVGQP